MTVSGGNMKPKNWKKRVVWISIFGFIVIWFAITYHYVGEVEINNPYTVFNANSQEQRVISPYVDKQDPNIIYLTFVQENGDSAKIDLKTKVVTPFHFEVNKWEEIKNLAIPFDPAVHRPGSPISIELRGREFTHSVIHLFGFPYPDSLGTYQARFRFGHWYVMDNRSGSKVSLLRIRVWNSDLNWDEFGDAYVSPDGRWTVFQMRGIHPTVYIFDRNATGSKDF